MRKKFLNLLVVSTVMGVLLSACGNTDTEVEGYELKQMINQQCQDTLEEVSDKSVYHDNKK